MTQTQFTLEVQPRIPKSLIRLEELAHDLQYSWDRQIRNLFFRLDSTLWETSGHNPKVFLRRVAQPLLEAAANDRSFMQDYQRILAIYDDYQAKYIRTDIQHLLDPKQDLVAYFCAEFGFHESVPIYSGGLGILAGDHCKAASDLGIPFIALGLLYRQGYFKQLIDAHGQQQVRYTPSSFQDLPITPAKNAAGETLYIHVDLPKRQVKVQVWQIKAGQIVLYLLDTDLEENSVEDRAITHQLYGGDKHTRIKQEIILGIGGVSALHALGLTPTVWHINEGHSAFQILERCRRHVAGGLDFDTALELVAAKTVFTTHTPVCSRA